MPRFDLGAVCATLCSIAWTTLAAMPAAASGGIEFLTPPAAMSLHSTVPLFIGGAVAIALAVVRVGED